MPRPSVDQLIRELTRSSSRRHLVGGAAGAVALGLTTGTGGAKLASAERGAAPDLKANRRKPRRPASERKRRNFNVRSTHVVTEAAVDGCNNPEGPSEGRCTTKFGGTAKASHLGGTVYASSFTSDWSQAVDTGDEGYCAPVTGVVTLRTMSTRKGRRGLLTLAIKGTVCETNGDGDSYPLVLNGSYSITKGTGAYAGANGNGLAQGAVQGAGVGEVASALLKGKIRY